jgi:hypothetical protein
MFLLHLHATHASSKQRCFIYVYKYQIFPLLSCNGIPKYPRVRNSYYLVCIKIVLTTSIIPSMTDYGTKASCIEMPPYVMSQAQTASHVISLPISPKPKHFLVRPSTNTIVPLVAIDELPQFISLRGMPRSMKLEDTIGMTNLGNVEGEGGYYDVVVDAGVETTGLGAVEKDSDSSPASSGNRSGSSIGNAVPIAIEPLA